MIRGIILDFDGLILNTEEAEYNAWEEIFQRLGAHLPVEDWALSMGIPSDEFDVIGILERATGSACDGRALKMEAHTRFMELLSLETVRPGVDLYLQAAKTSRLGTALATSSNLSWVAGHLKRLGLWDFFDVICTADDVKKVKPDPELFLLAASRLGLEPGETVVFEDSPKGIQAAKAAGCYCVAVPHKLSNLNGRAGADLVIQSMADTTLSDLLDDINQLL
jgi:beta-phosphoglucomutase-like phosphatase (HAD superfamily)